LEPTPRCTNGSVARSCSGKYRLGEVSSAIGFAISAGVALTLIEEVICEAIRAGAQHHSESEPRAEYTAPEAHQASAAEILHLAGPAAAFVDGAIPVTVQPGWLRIS
jgi:hypothetical protein